MRTAIPVLAVATLALAGCAAQRPSIRTPEQARVMTHGEAVQQVAIATEPGACFKSSQIAKHRVISDDAMYVRVGRRQVYRFDMTEPCLANPTGRDVLLHLDTAGSDTICRPSAIEIKFQRPGGAISQCVLKNYTLMSAKEVAALPRAQRP